MSSNYQVTNFNEEENAYRTCCGYCYLTKKQKRTCQTVIAAPFIAFAILVLAILLATATVGEKFQIENLSDREIKFINPSEEEVKGDCFSFCFYLTFNINLIKEFLQF